MSLFEKQFIKETCFKLNFKAYMIIDVLNYVEIFDKSKTHNFSQEVMLCSCIYLTSKIGEDFKRIRDIINVVYFVKNKYEIINRLEMTCDNEENYYLEKLKEDNYDNDKHHTLIKTMHNLTIENYYILRDEILKAEQHLLRVINYYFESKSKETFLIMLNYCDYLELDNKKIQFAWRILNLWYIKNF